MTNKAFFKKFILFCSPLIALFILVEILLVRAPNSYAFKRRLIEDHGSRVEVAIFGTSHAYHDYDPDKFSVPALNLANTSQSLQLDQQILARNLSKFLNLKLIVLNLSYFSFEYRLYGNVDDYREFLYTRYFNIAGDGGWQSLFDPRRLSMFANLGNEMTSKILFKGFGSRLDKEVTQSGWFNSSVTAYDHAPINVAVGRSRAMYHTSTLDTSLTDINMQVIRSIVRIAKDRNIQVVLAQAPAFTTYTDALDSEALSRFRANISSLQQTLDVKFYDYLRDQRFIEQDFYDNDHLNPEGAAKFSRIFGQEVIQPALQSAKSL